jgi:hypothetical protein
VATGLDGGEAANNEAGGPELTQPYYAAFARGRHLSMTHRHVCGVLTPAPFQLRSVA